jgi:hypothetical protein
VWKSKETMQIHIHGTGDADINNWGGALVAFPANMAPFPGAHKHFSR